MTPNVRAHRAALLGTNFSLLDYATNKKDQNDGDVQQTGKGRTERLRYCASR